ncbi:hypothetical protein BJX96DRAFT_169437 [Aspergillus floccosus]
MKTSRSIRRESLPDPFRHTALETVWVKCPYLPHPTRYIKHLELYDVVLAVVPLDEGCPVIGHVALAVIPGGVDRVHAIADGFCKWWIIYELWCLRSGMNPDIRARFLKNLLVARRSFEMFCSLAR